MTTSAPSADNEMSWTSATVPPNTIELRLSVCTGAPPAPGISMSEPALPLLEVLAHCNTTTLPGVNGPACDEASPRTMRGRRNNFLMGNWWVLCRTANFGPLASLVAHFTLGCHVYRRPQRNPLVMAEASGQSCTFFGFVLAKKVRTDPTPPPLLVRVGRAVPSAPQRSDCVQFAQ